MDSPDSKQQDLERAVEQPAEKALTTNQGLLIADNQNSLTVGARGPSLLEDFILREKITHFDHERIPERVVHARGVAAHGYFQVYESLASVTSAKFLQDTALRTPVFVRFSTVVGSRGSADVPRDVRGFATKFYTEQGVFDLVGNNIPVFFIQDAIKFPDLIHAVKPEPRSEIPQAASAHDTFWDFAWLTPEMTHMLLWAMSDRAIPRSLRMMDGFSVNTYRLVNDAGQAHLVKFHWRSTLGAHSVVWDEALTINGKDPDFHRRDLWEAIESGAYPEFEFGIQLIPEADQLNFSFDPLDATKVWPEEQVPLRRVGKMTLNRNPANYFAETEQVAFHPGHVVPGIDFSNDPLLQGRIFSYLDTQLTRLGGPNFAELPINRPIAPVHNNQRDGFMRHTINDAPTSYQPNSVGNGCPFEAGAAGGGYVSFAEPISASKVRERSDSFRDHFSQATLFWNSQSPVEQQHIVSAFRFELGKVMTREIRQHVVDLLTNVDLGLAAQVAEGIGVPAPGGSGAVSAANKRLSEAWDRYGVTSRPGPVKPSPVKKAPELSMLSTPHNSIKSRRIAVLAADGFDAAQLSTMKAALTAGGAVPELISALPMITSADGAEHVVDKTLNTVSSVLYDAVYVPGGQASARTLAQQGDALHFLAQAFKHFKAICATGEGVDVLLASSLSMALDGDKRDAEALGRVAGVVADRGAGEAAAEQFVAAIAQHRAWDRQGTERVPA